MLSRNQMTKSISAFIYGYSDIKYCPQRTGHFACRRTSSAPSEPELMRRLPGEDGSVHVPLSGMGLKLPEEGSPDRELLNDVIADVADFVMLKLQHSSSNSAYDNIFKKLMSMKHLDADYRRLL